MLPLGSSTIAVTFTPADATDYTTANATVSIYVVAPIPSISSLSPPITSAGNSGFTMTINGSGFVAGSTAYLGSTALATQYVSGIQLTAQVPAAAVVVAGTALVTVQTPAPGGGTSNILKLEIDTAGSNTPPTFNPVTATITGGGTATYNVTLPSGATNVSVTCLNLPVSATCNYSASSSTLTITTIAPTAPGSYFVTAVFTETLPGAAAALVLLPFLLAPMAGGKRRSKGQVLLLALLSLVFVMIAGSSGCGGSSGSTPTSTPTHQATSSAAVTLVVQ